MAEWTNAYVNDLPDSAFLYVAPGGEKDDRDRTVPRSLRFFPVRNREGRLDLPHLRNAIARIPQSTAPGLSAEAKERLQERARQMLEEETQASAKGFVQDDEVPPEIAELPKDQQKAWISVFNSTMRTFPGSDPEKEQAARLAAWSVVQSHWAPDGSVVEASARLSYSAKMAATSTRVVKFTNNLMEATERITLGEVYVPWDVDAHGDVTTPKVIERAAYNFMQKYQDAGVQHKGTGGKGDIVESFIARKGDPDFAEGSWVLGVKWNEPEWQRIISGELLGYSLDGVKTFVPLVAGQEFAKSSMRKAASEDVDPDADLIDDPERINTSPRVIKLMTDLEVMRVDGVSLPANRKQWKLFKSQGGDLVPKVTRVVGASKATPGGPWQKLYDQLVAQGMTTEEALAFLKEVFGPQLPPGWQPAQMKEAQEEPAQTQTDTVMSFAECAAQIDALMGVGSGVKVCSLLQAKFPAGPEGGIVLPEGKTLEEAARECAAEGERAGIIQLARVAPAEESVGILKSIKEGIGKILTRLGAKDSEHTQSAEVEASAETAQATETAKEDEPLTPEEKQAIDDRFTALDQKLDQILSSIGGGGPKAAGDPAPAPAAKEADPAAPYAPTPEQAGKDLIEIAQTVESLKAMITAPRDKGTSSVRQIMKHPAHKGMASSDDADDEVYSHIIGAPVRKSDRARVQSEEDERKEKKAARRAKRIVLRNV